MTISPNYITTLIDDPVAAALQRLAPWGDYARAINRAFPVDAEADAAFDLWAATRANHATRPLTVVDGTPRVVGRDIAPHIYEPTTNTRCARCNQPREEH